MKSLPSLCHSLLAIWLTVATAAVIARADTALPPPKTVARQLADPAQHKDGIAAITTWFDADPSNAANQFRGNWAKILLDTHDFAALDRFCVRAMLINAQDVGALEQLQIFRIRAAQGLQQPALALSYARQLFAICYMASTSSSLQLFAECLNAAHPNDPALVDAFRQQQTTGAVTQKADAPAKFLAPPTNAPASIMADVPIVAAPFDTAVASLFAEDYNSLLTRGNLLLLAGKPVEAQRVFERAYSLAYDGQIAQASENIARALKAQDNTIGRANSWVLALRPGK